MPYFKNRLPEYPVTEDMWDKIAKDPRPVMVYGMGNGADKLFARLEKYGRMPSEVFASDGFVRGHTYRGYKVISLSDVRAKYDDFIILLSFASNRSEVMEMIKDIDSKNTLFIPDMPVAGEEYFDKNFYNAHYSEICEAYGALCDEESKNAFSSIINYKLFGELKYLLQCYSDVSDIYNLLKEDITCAVDAGAYNGDTVRELLSYRPQTKRIIAIEPDRRNFKKLSKYVDEAELSCEVIPINAAVYSSDSAGHFSGSGNRNSSISSTVSYESRDEDVKLVRIDSVSDSNVDYIKYDVEGAEHEALIGSRETIEKYKPDLLVSAYHRSEDVFSLINYLKKEHPFYSIYMRRTLCFPAWEIALIAINEK
ncbi:MAG: FkbM family methyltransferase [Clostridia bacterium]|nr:FkbM family methyltransferase [Clostridia bacterium]